MPHVDPIKRREYLRRKDARKSRTASKKAQLRRRYYANREVILAKKKEYRRTERGRAVERAYFSRPHARLGMRLRSRIWRILKKRPQGVSAVGLLGCSAKEAVAHIERQFQRGMTWANWGEWHVDHIRPLSGFDLRDPAQAAGACHFTNLQPLWAKDNMAKGAKAVYLL
jgi:hypothetical protein